MGSSSCRLMVGCGPKIMTIDTHWIHVCENLYADVYVPFSLFVFTYSHSHTNIHTDIGTSPQKFVVFSLYPLPLNQVNFLTSAAVMFSSQ